MVDPGVGPKEYEEAVLHDAEAHIGLGVALIAELVLKKSDLSNM